ncbi:MAG: aminotransferase class III-fold pyridoxal phosphate-dependent enzyme [Saprospiraceae bacterium]|nr:aminotransferase class III-fold pyridoxal phosphate-dependent enzyme [Saprospiraceae bacterium]MDG2419428.1 aminotransferase class III-fold pyridoxal phosphate-dependent enzyme [Saprospiraceae bacterium]
MKLFDVYPLFDIHPVKGEGCYIFDGQGNKYLDLYGGHAVISVGHSHPHFVKKLTIQLQHLGFYSNSLKNDLQIELAKKLGKLSNCEEYNLFLCNSGAEANENALKLASFQNKKTKIIAFKKGFHGRTSAAVSVTDNVKIQAPINKTFETELHNFNEIETIEASLKKGNVCAVIIEGIQGIGGVEIPKPKFLEVLESLCKKYNTILILDEIQSGYGRSGEFFAFQKSTITPDIITIAKGMGNGFPIGGVLIHPKFKAKYGLLGTTFGGNHLACAAGIAVLDILKKENLIAHSKELGNYFLEKLKTVEGISEVRGSGLMIGLEFDFPIKELRKHLLFKEKIFTGSSSNPNVMRVLPPLNIQKEHVDFFIKKLETALKLIPTPSPI